MRSVTPILLGLAALVALAVALVACKPKGEEADYKRLVEALERKDSLIQGWGHWKFPDDEPEKATAQIAAIRAFAKTYPKSEYVTRIIVDHLFPNLWYDVERNGVVVEGGSGVQWLSLLAWELHQLSPTSRDYFAETLEEELSMLPQAGHALRRLAEELGDAELAKRAKARFLADKDNALVERRKSAIRALAGAKQPAQVAMRTLLKSFDDPGDRVVIEVDGHEPDSWVHKELDATLADNLRRQAGIRAWSAAWRGGSQERVLLRVTLSSEVRQLAVVVKLQPVTTTTTAQTSERRWNHGMQAWRYETVNRTVTTEHGGGEEGDSYPVYTAEVSIAPASGEPAWKGAVSSDWKWARHPGTGEHAGFPLEEGAEVPSDPAGFSVENLADRISHTLLGPAYKKGLQ